MGYDLTSIAQRAKVGSVYGARPLKRLIQHELVDKLALQLLYGEIKEGQMVKVDVSKSGELIIKA
jgi:ATP-dependent Clp protease ATP-binding subunit ClpB